MLRRLEQLQSEGTRTAPKFEKCDGVGREMELVRFGGGGLVEVVKKLFS